MRKTMHTLAAVMLAALAACGGGEEAVDETGTADTEIFTDSPDTTGIAPAGQGGTMADSTPPAPGSTMPDPAAAGPMQDSAAATQTP